MNCPICGNPYVMGGQSHTRCMNEQTERTKDFEFLRALRHECDLRGMTYADFIAQLFLAIESDGPYADYDFPKYD